MNNKIEIHKNDLEAIGSAGLWLEEAIRQTMNGKGYSVNWLEGYAGYEGKADSIGGAKVVFMFYFRKTWGRGVSLELTREELKDFAINDKFKELEKTILKKIKLFKSKA